MVKRLVPLFFTCYLAACTVLPDLSTREPSLYIPTVHAPQLEAALQLPPNHTNDISTATTIASDVNAEPIFLSDAHLIAHAHDAFAVRAQLIDKSQVSIDAQYYIWHNDVSGSLLLQKLWHAAERGVRVRLLLDDNNTRGMDDVLAALNTHPNIQIRLFNPFMYRKWRALGYLSDFPRVNRRMHNKSLTADNRASIIGGRNIGDEYLDDSGVQTTFSDMDVLVSGSIVTRISQEFDRYWCSDSAYPLERIITHPHLKRGKNILLNEHNQDIIYQDYLSKIQHTPLLQAAAHGELHYIRAPMQLVSDDPAKALDRKVRVNIWQEIIRALGKPLREVYLVSPYFVPTDMGVNIIKKLHENGVQTTILTNSLSATDVATVHSGYLRYRKPLLQSGVQLYELKAESQVKHLTDKGLTGSSSTSLHAKTFVVDQQRVFIGSFNLDPRSARLNTEMGLVIHQPQLATSLQHLMQQEAQENAYHINLKEKNTLEWYDPTTGEITHHEPQTHWYKRLWSKFLSWLPIERLL